jgi:hypothetical protein
MNEICREGKKVIREKKVVEGKNVIPPRCCYPNGDGFRENSKYIATDY